jgi:lipid II:glycine glycyltransferase (peptidoglycan interpeptide bridge formation enzyme)
LNGRVVYEWYASGIETCRDDVRPLSVAIWGELLFAVEKDCPIFDFMGAGVPGEPYGVRDFKSEFGGKQVEYGRFLYKCNSILYWIGKLGVKWLRR